VTLPWLKHRRPLAMMDREKEIALALSACPPGLAEKAGT
jgi:hypothetical protein